MFISDVLLFLSVSQLLKFRRKPLLSKPQHTTMNADENSASGLVEFLQDSAVEQMTTYRQQMAQDFGSVATIVTTDFEALNMYKRCDYQQCLQLSIQNVHTLLYAVRLPDVPVLPEFIQLFDDDIVSLTALMLIVNPGCTEFDIRCASVSQLTLSLYLRTQCQLVL